MFDQMATIQRTGNFNLFVGENKIKDTEYSGGFKPGDICSYNGMFSIGPQVEVVKWEPEKWWGKCKDSNLFKVGMVPVFSSDFPKVKFWWASPTQLTLVKRK